MFAIVETGGKQYRVQEGDTIDVELLDAQPGESVELDRVLMLGGEGGATVGQPAVAGARVVAEVLEHAKGKKIVIFKFKNKIRYRRKTGHRQSLTRLRIVGIQGEGGNGA